MIIAVLTLDNVTLREAKSISINILHNYLGIIHFPIIGVNEDHINISLILIKNIPEHELTCLKEFYDIEIKEEKNRIRVVYLLSYIIPFMVTIFIKIIKEKGLKFRRGIFLFKKFYI